MDIISLSVGFIPITSCRNYRTETMMTYFVPKARNSPNPPSRTVRMVDIHTLLERKTVLSIAGSYLSTRLVLRVKFPLHVGASVSILGEEDGEYYLL